MTREQDLSVRELLVNTFEEVRRITGSPEVELPKPVYSEIANDSDHHRMREGFMEYKTVCFFANFKGKHWLFARGESYGDYPARPFDSDLIAIPIGTAVSLAVTLECIVTEIARGAYFHNTLVCGLTNGQLTARSSSRFLGEPIRSSLARFVEFVSQRLEVDRDIFLASTLNRLTIKAARYRKELVPILAQAILHTLSR